MVFIRHIGFIVVYMSCQYGWVILFPNFCLGLKDELYEPKNNETVIDSPLWCIFVIYEWQVILPFQPAVKCFFFPFWSVRKYAVNSFNVYYLWLLNWIIYLYWDLRRLWRLKGSFTGMKHNFPFVDSNQYINNSQLSWAVEVTTDNGHNAHVCLEEFN